MKFLARDEAALLEKKLRREIAEHAGPKSVLYYESDSRDYATVANEVALSIGKFSEATVVFLWCLDGDGWDEPSASAMKRLVWLEAQREGLHGVPAPDRGRF